MYNFDENPLIRGIYASRYIASYNNIAGKIYPWPFRKWLNQLIINGEPLSETDVEFLVNRATNGKLELEENAKKWFGQN